MESAASRRSAGHSSSICRKEEAFYAPFRGGNLLLATKRQLLGGEGAARCRPCSNCAPINRQSPGDLRSRRSRRRRSSAAIFEQEKTPKKVWLQLRWEEKSIGCIEQYTHLLFKRAHQGPALTFPQLHVFKGPTSHRIPLCFPTKIGASILSVTHLTGLLELIWEEKMLRGWTHPFVMSQITLLPHH